MQFMGMTPNRLRVLSLGMSLPIDAETCFIGFKSGDLGGFGKATISGCCRNHALTTYAVFMGLFSQTRKKKKKIRFRESHMSHCGQQNVFEDVNVTFACESLWTHVNQLAYATRGHPPKQTSCESNAPCAFHKSVICGV